MDAEWAKQCKTHYEIYKTSLLENTLSLNVHSYLAKINFQANGKTCIRFGYQGDWADGSCDMQRDFICETLENGNRG